MNNGRGVEHLDICYFAQSIFGQPENIPAPPKCACGFIYPSQGLSTTRNTFTHINTDSSSSVTKTRLLWKGWSFSSLLNPGCVRCVTDNKPIKMPSSIPANSCAGVRQPLRCWIYLQESRGCFEVHLLQQL